MQNYYLTHSCAETAPDRTAFFSTDSASIAERLIKLLDKANPGFHEFFASERPPDEDAAILWDESIERIDVLSQCDGDFGVFDFKVSELQKKLVQFYSDCARWEATIREREANQPKAIRPFYIVLNWFDEGYSGTRPVYRVEERDIAEQLMEAANTKFASDPQDLTEVGAAASFSVVDAAKAPSRIVWDAKLQELADATKSGNRDDDAGIYAACADWEATIRKQCLSPPIDTSGEQPIVNQTAAAQPASAVNLDFPVGLQLNICRRPPSAILHILTSAMRRTNSFPPRDRPFGHSLGVFAAILGRSIGVVAATLTDPSR